EEVDRLVVAHRVASSWAGFTVGVRRQALPPPNVEIENMLSTCLAWSLCQGQGRNAVPRYDPSGRHGSAESTEQGHDIGPQDRGAGREESRPAARRGRAIDDRRGLRRGDVASSRAQGGIETPAGALLLPHHGG